MGINSVTSMNSMSVMQMNMAGSTDPNIKKIEDKITDTEQQIRILSSKNDLSVMEKADERKKLKTEISSLNTKLEQHQDAFLKSQKREIRMAQLLEDPEPTNEDKSKYKIQTSDISSDQTDKKSPSTDKLQSDHQGTVIAKSKDGIVLLKDEGTQDEKRGINTGKEQADEISLGKADEKNLPTGNLQTAVAEETKEADNAEKETKTTDSNMDTGLSREEVHSIISADASAQQAERQGTVITRIRGGIVILKGEINQDEKRGINTDRKQAELEKMQKKEQKATAFQFSVLGEANNTMKSAAKTNVSGTLNKPQANTGNSTFLNAFKSWQADNQASQQMFSVSFGH